MAKGLCHTCKCVLTAENCGSSRFRNFGESAYCRPCEKIRFQKYNKEHKEELVRKRAKYNKEVWYPTLKNDPERWEKYVASKREQYRAMPIEERKKRRKSRTGIIWSYRGRKYLYGIEPEEFEAKLKEQDGKCAICGKVLSINATNKNDKPHQDHNHETKENRGILCNLCNVFLGNARDSIEFLANAIKYLRKYTRDSLIQIEGVKGDPE